MSGGTDGIFYANITSARATIISYSFICIDDFGNENRTSYNTFTVNKAGSSLNLFLNGTDASKNYQNGSYANFTALEQNGLNVSISANISGWIDQENKISPYENITQILCEENSNFNITDWFPGSENYTLSSKTNYVMCFKTLPLGNYTHYFCEGNYSVENKSSALGSNYEYFYCDYGCNKQALKYLDGFGFIKCNPNPTTQNLTVIGIVIVLFVVMFLVIPKIRG
jgi:hypothetical protein